jgi:hypothetical protein
VQQNHPPLFVDVEEDTRNSVLGQVGPYFVDAAAKRSTGWHTNWPAKLHRLDILADAFPIFG